MDCDLKKKKKSIKRDTLKNTELNQNGILDNPNNPQKKEKWKT